MKMIIGLLGKVLLLPVAVAINAALAVVIGVFVGFGAVGMDLGIMMAQWALGFF